MDAELVVAIVVVTSPLWLLLLWVVVASLVDRVSNWRAVNGF